jgi:hypothetical protein
MIYRGHSGTRIVTMAAAARAGLSSPSRAQATKNRLHRLHVRNAARRLDRGREPYMCAPAAQPSASALGSARDGTGARQPTEPLDQILPDGAESEGGHQRRTNVSQTLTALYATEAG